jgi:hypothetical protein
MGREQMGMAATAIIVILVLGTLLVHIGNYRLRQQRDWRAKGLLLLGCLLAMGIAAQYYVNHKLAAPRTLSDSQMHWIAEQSSPFKGHRVIVGAVPLSSESFDLANTIVETLKLKPAEMNANINQAGVAAEMGIAGPYMKSTPEGIVSGVLVKYTTGNDKGQSFAAAFVAALMAENITAFAVGGSNEDQIEGRISQGLDPQRNDLRNEPIIVVVGDKP